MNTTEFKEIGFNVCEPHFKNESSMTTWVLRRVNQTNKQFIIYANKADVEKFWREAIEQEKAFVKNSIGEPSEPKPWEALSNLIIEDTKPECK